LSLRNPIYCLEKSSLNDRSDARSPSSAKTTDLALLTGSEINPSGAQPVQGSPIETSPKSRAIMHGQIPQIEDGLIDFIISIIRWR
jgi:hypothetical protein